MSESTGIKFITATSQTTAREPRKWKDMTATSILFGFGFNTNILWIQPISIKGCKQTLLLTLSLYNFRTYCTVFTWLNPAANQKNVGFIWGLREKQLCNLHDLESQVWILIYWNWFIQFGGRGVQLSQGSIHGAPSNPSLTQEDQWKRLLIH